MPKIPGLGASALTAGELRRRCARIKLLVLDVDGVLTDGGMYFGPDGEVLKRFDTRDGVGIVQAMNAGIEVAFLTREATPFAKARADKLGVARCISGALDKAASLRTLQAEVGAAPAETAYVGDDLGDAPCIPMVGLFFMPADGWLKGTKGLHVVLEKGGGRGAVRQAVTFLLDHRGRK